jgi:competence protein ComEC
VNRLNGLLLSHGDSQHIGGAARLLSDLRSRILIDNPAPDRSSIHKRVRRLVDDRKLPVKRPVQGDRFEVGPGLSCSVLYPPHGFSSSISDDQALVLRMNVTNGPNILFMSDSGLATEKALLGAGMDLHSDIVIKGQHHSGKSGSNEFLAAVRPQLVIATSRDFPQHERIDDQWAEELRRRDIKLFRQNDTGAVEIYLRPNEWVARAYLTGETFRSKSR